MAYVMLKHVLVNSMEKGGCSINDLFKMSNSAQKTKYMKNCWCGH